MRRNSRLLYPRPLWGPLFPATVGADMAKVEDYLTFFPTARRVPLQFSGAVSLLVRVSSQIGSRNDWIRAGVLAQVLRGLPTGDANSQVRRIYLDDGFFKFDGDGFNFYFEFWPQVWLKDYRLEIWAQRTPAQ